jgi:hypothetical protein
MKNLMLPIQDLETLYNENNELSVKHFKGDAAIQLRFDGNTGRFKYGDADFITNVGEEFTFNPIAFRAFFGRPFEAYKTPELWLELFGITQAKCTFRILLRGSSATELNKFAYFLNVRPTETILKLKPVMRHAKEFNKNYYIVSPEFDPVPKRDKQILEELKCMLYIYSNQLIIKDCDGQPYTTIMCENYCNEDYINEDAFRFFKITENTPTLTSIIGDAKGIQAPTHDPLLLELPSNQKGVKKAA